MKIIADASQLKNDLAVVARAVSPRSTLPVLANVLIDCSEERTFFSATNLEIAISKLTNVTVKEPGKITLPCAPLSELLGKLSGELTIDVNPKNMRATIKTKSGNYTLSGISADEFPPLPSKDEKHNTITMEMEKFAQAARRVVYSASTDEARPILTGVLFEAVANTITLQSADGFRMSQDCFAFGRASWNVEKGKLSTVIPARAMTELLRITKTGEVAVTINNANVMFVGDDWSLTTQRIEGSFPDLSQIIPTHLKIRAYVLVSDLKAILERCSIYRKDMVKLEFDKDKLTARAVTDEIGEGDDSMEIATEGIDGLLGIKIAFNTAYLLEMLGTITGEVIIDLTTDSSPGKFSQKDNNWISVIMPMNISK